MAFYRYSAELLGGIPNSLRPDTPYSVEQYKGILNGHSVEVSPLKTGKPTLVTPRNLRGRLPFIFVTQASDDLLNVRFIVDANQGYFTSPHFRLAKPDVSYGPSDIPFGIQLYSSENRSSTLHEMVLWHPPTIE